MPRTSARHATISRVNWGFPTIKSRHSISIRYVYPKKNGTNGSVLRLTVILRCGTGSMSLLFVSGVICRSRLLKEVSREGKPRRLRHMSSRVTRASLPSSSQGVVITGSTKGIGRALAEEFAKQSDGVVISSRTQEAVDATVRSLRQMYPSARVFGCKADVGRHADVVRLADFAVDSLGTVNTFICNAASIGRKGPIVDADPEDLENVVRTNMLGSMFCAKEAQRLAKNQAVPMHVFLMDGSGTRGGSTAMYAAYGATKRSVPQLIASLSTEAKNAPVRFHALSPGMVLTDLLLSENVEASSRRIFNYLAEEPETVAQDLVPRIRDVVINDKSTTYVQFLTIPKALFQLTTGFLLGLRKDKFFDSITGSRVDSTGRFQSNGVRLKE